MIYQLKRLCVPDRAYTENMFINSIHISLYDIYLTQNIYVKLTGVNVTVFITEENRKVSTYQRDLGTERVGNIHSYVFTNEFSTISG